MSVLPLFTSDHSICDSILTLSKDIFVKVTEMKDGKEVIRETTEIDIKDNSPVSIFAIAKKHNLPNVTLVDTSMSSFWEAYKVAKSLKLNLIFGYKVCVCDDMTKKDEDSIKTESNVIIFCKNSDGYRDLIRISSKASVEGFYHRPRISWMELNTIWTENLLLAVPFYSSFLAENIMKLNRRAMPDFKNIPDPIFLRESHDLPFDGLINTTLENYCKINKHEILDTHTINYYNDEDCAAFQVLKCVNHRSVFTKPNLEHFGSDKFSFQAYLKKVA